MEIAPSSEPDVRAIRVLLVEDELFLRIDVAAVLREAEFQVIEAADADEAWAFIKAGEAPDLLLTDVRTPGHLDGITLAEKVRSQFPELPIIIASGDIESERRAARLGQFVPKPYDPMAMVRLVIEIVGEPSKKP